MSNRTYLLAKRTYTAKGEKIPYARRRSGKHTYETLSLIERWQRMAIPCPVCGRYSPRMLGACDPLARTARQQRLHQEVWQ